MIIEAYGDNGKVFVEVDELQCLNYSCGCFNFVPVGASAFRCCECGEVTDYDVASERKEVSDYRDEMDEVLELFEPIPEDLPDHMKPIDGHWC